MKQFQQAPPALGNQYDDDRVLRSYLARVLPGDMLREMEESLGKWGAWRARNSTSPVSRPVERAYPYAMGRVGKSHRQDRSDAFVAFG